MSARKIPKNYRNVTGIAANIKSEGGAPFESTLERDFLYLLEFSPEVERIKVQPVKIEWEDEKGRNRSYVPDVFVQYVEAAGLKPVLFEVKYRSDIAKNWDKLKPKFKQGIAHAKKHGWRFKIISDVEIRTQELENVRFLVPFLRRGCPSQSDTALILSKAQKMQTFTPRVLLNALSEDELEQARLLSTLWFLVGSLQIGCDLAKKISMVSKLWSLT